MQELSPEEEIHQCADITILENLSSSQSLAAIKEARASCGGICENGGSCQNGECVCRDGFAGTFCDEEEESVAGELIWFIIIGAILVLAALLFYNAPKLK